MLSVLTAGPLSGQDGLDHFHFLKFPVYEEKKKVTIFSNGVVMVEQPLTMK